MRILFSNPDGIGDFVLRQPMYSALSNAGHELLLMVRQFAAPIAGLVAPGARTIVLESNPYSSAFNPASGDVRRVLEAAREFAPDVFCIAPYQRTEIDELLAEYLNGCPTLGMTGFLYLGAMDSGQKRQSRFRLDRQVKVSVDQHETEKNEQLCSELLGKPIHLPDPAIRAEKAHIESAQFAINRLGIEPGKFWIACVGDNHWSPIKNWTPENWAKALSHAVARHDQKFLMIGTPDEHATTDQIRKLMGKDGDATENLCDAPPSLTTTVGLLHLSAGYIGRDTGPMHLAAALGKPVIAAFGGGHWPRFTPKAKVGAVVSVAMPCAGCGWECHLPESYCVKQVPVDTILEAIDSIQSGVLRHVRIQQLSLSAMLGARVIRESAKTCRELRRLAAANTREIVAVSGERDRLAERSGKLHEQISIKQQREDQLNEQLASAKTECDRLEALVRDEQLKAQAALRDAEGLVRDEQLKAQAALRDAEGLVRSEQLKAQSAKRDAEKIRKQADAERQSVVEVLNDLFVEHSTLKHKVDAEMAEAVRLCEEEFSAVRARLHAVEHSLSFRVGVRVGRPVVAVHAKLRSLFSRARN
jgi:ADP-heptose:LPS heptosyltransferase